MSKEKEGGSVIYIETGLMSRGLQGEIKRVERQIEYTEEHLMMIKAAENALGEIQTILQQMRELAVEAAINPDADREVLGKRFEESKQSIDRIVAGATYNGKNLLDGSMGSIDSVLAAVNEALEWLS